MSRKRMSTLFVFLLLFVALIPVVNSISVNDTGVEKKPQHWFQRLDIVVSSDDDFIGPYWSGDGTAENPYVLIPRMFYGSHIQIRNTVSHFVIKDIILQAHEDYYTRNPDKSIMLLNVKNGIIVHSSIKPSLFSPGPPDDLDYIAAITITNSTSIVVEDCIIADAGRGLWIVNSSNTVVVDNQIQGSRIGIDIDASLNTSVIDNKIIENADYGVRILEGSHNSTIVGNYLGYNGISNALDNETSTTWNIDAEGNWWDDYNESGVYNISGLGSNFDGSPQLLDQDVSPPDIELELGSKYYWWGPYTTFTWTLTASPYPVTPSFSAIVTDASGIDSVYLCTNDENNSLMMYEMTKNAGSDRYTYTFPDEYYDFHVLFYVWANDTAGNVWISIVREFRYLGYPRTTEPTSPTYPVGYFPIMYFTIGVIITVVVGVLVYICKARER
ncbi:MAG: right-handed parallel beta-helix repeat-containing protein [Candidatus Thorarchaeota archaeon]